MEGAEPHRAAHQLLLWAWGPQTLVIFAEPKAVRQLGGPGIRKLVLALAQCPSESATWPPGAEATTGSGTRLLQGSKHEDDALTSPQSSPLGLDEARPARAPVHLPACFRPKCYRPVRDIVPSEQTLPLGFVGSTEQRSPKSRQSQPTRRGRQGTHLQARLLHSPAAASRQLSRGPHRPTVSLCPCRRALCEHMCARL